jgi:hypothetical protein
MQPISEEELDARLADADPVDQSVIAAARLDDALGRVHAAVTCSPQASQRSLARSPAPGLERSPWLPQRRRLLTATAVVVAVAAVALVGVGALTPDSSSVGPPLAVPTAAAAEFRHLAQAVKRTMPTPTPVKGAEVVSESVALSGVGEMPLESVRRTVRFRYSVHARVEVQNGVPHGGVESLGAAVAFADAAVSFPTQAALDLYRSQPSLTPRRLAQWGSIDYPQTNDLIGGAGSVPPSELATLPHTAAALLARLRADYLKPQPNWNHGHVSDRPPYSETRALWGALKSILERSTNPAVMAAAYQALASVSDIQVHGTATDARGRRGVAIIFIGTPGETDSVIVDQQTGQILQRALTATTAQNGWPAGTVLTQEVWLARSLTFSSHPPLTVGP